MTDQSTKLDLAEGYLVRNDEIEDVNGYHNRVVFKTGGKLGIPSDLLIKFGDLGVRVSSCSGTNCYQVRAE